jgi:hypothetical protein
LIRFTACVLNPGSYIHRIAHGKVFLLLPISPQTSPECDAHLNSGKNPFSPEPVPTLFNIFSCGISA